MMGLFKFISGMLPRGSSCHE